jgi:predicted amidohydrolase
MRKTTSFADFARQVEYFVDVAADYGSHFVLFPELFTLQLLSHLNVLSPQEGMKKLSAYTPKLRRLLSDNAKKYGLTIVGGSHPVMQGTKLYNMSHICLPDGRIFEQSKLHVTPNERKWWGVNGGNQLAVIDTPKARVGVMICYDVEFPEPVRYLADAGAEIIFVPFCTDNRQSYLRVRYCAQARAVENHIYVALAGNVGNLPDVTNMDVQYGQAAVLTPSDFAFSSDGIAAEADANEETVLVCDLDLDALHQSRADGTVTPRLDRRSDIFQFVTTFRGGIDRVRPVNEGPLGEQVLPVAKDSPEGE